MREKWRAAREAAIFLLLLLVAGRVLPFGAGQFPMVNKQMKSFSLPFSEILPQEIFGWTRSREDQVFDRENIFDYMDGGGEIYLAYDFSALLVREYTKPEAPSIVVEIYQMSSSEDAYGVYTHDTDGNDLNLGQGAVYAAGLLRFWKDTVFVRVMADRETPEAEAVVMNLGRTIAAAILQNGKKPGLLGFLPTDGLLAKNLRYFHTQILLNAHYYLANANVLNLSSNIQAVLARYERKDGRARLLLVGYLSVAEALDAAKAFVEMYLHEKLDPKRGEVEPKKLENGKYAGIVIKGSCLIIIVESETKTLLERLSREISKNLEGKES